MPLGDTMDPGMIAQPGATPVIKPVVTKLFGTTADGKKKKKAGRLSALAQARGSMGTSPYGASISRDPGTETRY